MPHFLISVIFNNHSHSTVQSYINASFTIRRGLFSCILINSSLSKNRTSIGCLAENQTRPAFQQAIALPTDPRRTLTESRHTLTEPRRTLTDQHHTLYTHAAPYWAHAAP